MSKVNYGEAIRFGFEFLLENHSDVVLLGQGLWSPWYVGNSMTDLDTKFGKNRVIDTPVSESACTGAAVGASLAGLKAVVIHPRMDFMVLATDPIVNQAAKWSHMLGGQAHPAVTIRAIINRGGEQGAQHSQALHAWYAHIPGLRVVMPSTVQDARDLLIASVLSSDPVLYIDDRWLYDLEDELEEPRDFELTNIRPQVLESGTDITIVGSSYSTQLALKARRLMATKNLSAEVIDLRVLNPLKLQTVECSVLKTGRLLVVDGGWRSCGMGGEILASITERLPLEAWKARPQRVTLPCTPAPTSKPLEELYYPTAERVAEVGISLCKGIALSRESKREIAEITL